ncbi:WbqC family protein [Sulfurimonas sp.]|jgi:hypothetical protein|uniref:WbqC family protein n=1 Tax=Sulfurimonas sp. TaxID=2022749 RepID=UPI0025E12840|nr:WbqC family protein [Sulfurimonas sp.]MCK9472186.1 WbqC family protein [Sulfurimonas sp.]MDD3505898.1 WbqC family protein [Sulfurimonas sp.]
MKLAIMQPYFFPYIGYWQLINAVDTFVVYDDVNYINKSYINRNSILMSGQKQRVTLELLGATQNKLINEIEIGGNQKKLLKTIQTAYKKAPFFDDVYAVLENILMQKEKNLAHFLDFLLKRVSLYLGIDTEFIYSSDIKKNNKLKAQEKIIDIAKILKAKNYINAIGGQAIYTKEGFEQDGIAINFLKTTPLEYKQFNNVFIPNLSIIDVMMFNDKNEITKILSKYELI